MKWFTFILFMFILFIWSLISGYGDNNVKASEVISEDCGDGVCEAGEDAFSCPKDCMKIEIDLRINESEQKEEVRRFIEQRRYSTPYWNNGQDFGQVLQQQINSLPEGSTLIIPPGRYNVSTPLIITKQNITVKAETFGDGIFETQNVSSNLINIDSYNVTIENLILVGNRQQSITAIVINGISNKLLSNVISNFDYALLINSNLNNSNNNLVKGNYFFDNGYYSLEIRGGRNATSLLCTSIAKNNIVRDNFLSKNYQGIVTYCADNTIIFNNIVKESNISGIRIETSSNSLFQRNFVSENYLDGLWIYGGSSNNSYVENIIIDNNKQNMPFSFDCWTSQTSLSDDYQYNKDRVFYPFLRQENENYIHTNYWCQFNGLEIELRNSIQNNTFLNNIIGRYKLQFDNSVGWQSPYDLRISYFPLFYSSDLTKLSRNNIFNNNYFIGSNNDRILDQGCENTYSNNKRINFNPYEEQDFNININEQVLCSQTSPCNDNGSCDYLLGEKHSKCPLDCPLFSLGEKGTRRHYDQCSNSNITEELFPALPGCNNLYTGDFYCTNCGDGVCDNTEHYCTCPIDCSLGSCNNNSICELGETSTNCPDCPTTLCGNNQVDSGEVCDGTDLGGLTNLTCGDLGFSNNSDQQLTQCSPDCKGINTISCASPPEVPFFTNFNLILTLLILVSYYYFKKEV